MKRIILILALCCLRDAASFTTRDIRRPSGTSFKLQIRAKPDFIDVDIDDGSPSSNRDDEKGRAGVTGANLFRPNAGDQEEEKESSGGLLGGIVNTISKVFGGPTSEKQSLAARKKQERKNEMDTAIDSIFDEVGGGRGLTGGLLKAAAKSVGGIISEMASDYSSDIIEIQELVIAEVEQDSKASFIVGTEVRAGAPFSSSSYSTSVNGVTTKRMSYIMPVAGSKGQAQAEVEASERGGTITIQQLTLSNGISRTTIISPGGRGGGGRGGDRGPSGGSGDVIDVEAI